MNQEMTEQISEGKKMANGAKWREMIQSCQGSGKTVAVWCEENGVPQSTYYRNLRLVREEFLNGEQQIVPIKTKPPQGIRITAGMINIALPENAAPDQLKAIIEALKKC